MPVNETLYITPNNPGAPVVCGPSMGLPEGLNLSSACVLFGTPTTPGTSVNVYLDVSNYVVRVLTLPTHDALASETHALILASLAAPVHWAVRHRRVRFLPSEPASAEPIFPKPAAKPASAELVSCRPASQPASQPAAVSHPDAA